MSKGPIKDLLLNEIKDAMSSSQSMIVTRYEKHKPLKNWVLRKDLLAAGAKLKVVRKSIFLKAAQACNITFDDKLIDGNVGVGVIVVDRQDPIDAVKLMFKYSKDNQEDKIDVICAQIDGQMMPGAEVKILSSLPTLDVLRAQFIALLVAPMAQTLSVMQAAIDGPLAQPLAQPEQTTQTE